MLLRLPRIPRYLSATMRVCGHHNDHGRYPGAVNMGWVPDGELGRDMERMMYALLIGGVLAGATGAAVIIWLIQRVAR